MCVVYSMRCHCRSFYCLLKISIITCSYSTVQVTAVYCLVYKLPGLEWKMLQFSVCCDNCISTAPQSGHALLTPVGSMCSWTLPCASSLAPSVLHLSHGFQCSPTLNVNVHVKQYTLQFSEMSVNLCEEMGFQPSSKLSVTNWTTSPTNEGCHWQAGGDNPQT